MNCLKMNVFFLIISLILSCGESDDLPTGPVDPGNDPNFTIVTNEDNRFQKFNRKVVVFDIPILAVPKVEDRKLLHAANILAQYLDNDENGQVDDELLWETMKNNKAFMVMWKRESDLDDIDPPNGWIGQDLGNDETIPEWHNNGHTGRFDAAIEEVLHIVNNAGHAWAYPEAFAFEQGSELSNAMDVARGGVFQNPPSNYPAGTWYTYDDPTCDYECQGAEYMYWAMTSILGAQENRLDEIGHEWKLNTREKLEQLDAKVYNLLTDPKYKMPTVLPDGTYRR